MICVIVELLVLGASLVAQMVKRNLPAMQETWVQFLGQKDYLEKGMATHSSILENSMDRGAWQATVHGVAKSWTQLSNRHTHTASLLFLHIFYQRVDMVTPSSLRRGWGNMPNAPDCPLRSREGPEARTHKKLIINTNFTEDDQ